MNNIPRLNNEKKVVLFENISQKNSFGIYNTLIQNNIIDDIYNVIILCDHKCKLGDKYDNNPDIIDIVENKNFYDILENIIK
jgi:hypothetical protein